jgi:PhnB protein
MKNLDKEKAVRYSIAPWLSIRGSLKALDFYKTAFGAVETHRLDVPDGVIARLSIHGAEFWIAESSEDGAGTLKSDSVRFILTVPDPDAMFVQAVLAGAREVYPVGEEHGWRLGRVVDPFGLHWEIGRELS